MTRLIAATSLFVFFFAGVPAQAEIYRYFSPDGTMHVSDQPLPGYKPLPTDKVIIGGDPDRRDDFTQYLQPPPAESAEQTKLLEREAKRMGKDLKSYKFKKKFQAECRYKKDDRPVRGGIVCTLSFPGEFHVGRVPMRYVHDIEVFTLQVTRSFSRKESQPSFLIQSLVNIEGDPTPVCSFDYNQQFDVITPILVP